MSHVQGQSPIPASGIPGAPIPYAASMSLDKEKGRLAEEDLLLLRFAYFCACIF